MTMNHTIYDTVNVIDLPSQLVMANAKQTREALFHMIDEGHHRLALNLSGISFIDSSGLSVLVSTLRAAHDKDGAVVLLSPTDDVRSLIELTRLHHIFDIYEDRDEAVKQLSQVESA